MGNDAGCKAGSHKSDPQPRISSSPACSSAGLCSKCFMQEVVGRATVSAGTESLWSMLVPHVPPSAYRLCLRIFIERLLQLASPHKFFGCMVKA